MNLDPIDRDLLIRTVIGEAQSEPEEGKAGVAHVVLNRMARGDGDLQDVIFAEQQFEPWSTRRDELLRISPKSMAYADAARVVDSVLGGSEDITGGATHFLNADIVRERRGGSLPAWASGKGQMIGRHSFYAPEGRVTRVAAASSDLPEGFEIVEEEASGLPEGFELVEENAASPAAPPVEAKVEETVPAGREMGLTEYAMQALPFGDEVAAAGGALGRYIGKTIRGDETSLGGEYDAIRAEDEKARGRFAAENPGTSTAANVGGAVISGPGSAAAIAPTLVGRALQGAKSSAVLGGLYGAGEGDSLGERAANATGGALISGAAGAVAAPVIEGVVQGGRAISRALGPIRGAANPDAEAARRVVAALEADAGPDAAQRAAQLLDDAQQAGVPLTLADAGDEATRALARSAANTSMEGRGQLQAVLGDRFENQADRTGQFIKALTGAQADTAATLERVQQTARHINRKAYNEAYRQGATGIWDDELAQLTQAPSVQTAIRKASRTNANRATADGFDPPQNPFKFENGVLTPKEGVTPNLQFWDAVKRNLDDEIGILQRKGAKSEAADALALRNRIVEKMDDLVPAYRDARRGAAAFFEAEDALEAGQKFVGSQMENATARRAIEAMSKPEKTLFQEGFANELIRKINSMGDSRNVANSIFLKSPQARERIEIALGKGASDRIEAFVRVENVMNQTRQALTGNSTTARQLAELGLAGGVSGGLYGYISGDGVGSNAALGAILGAGMRKGYSLIDERVATRVGKLLASQDPEVVRKAVEMVSRNPRLLEALRAGEEYLGRFFAPSGSDVGSGLVPAMADDLDEQRQQGNSPLAQQPSG